LETSHSASKTSQLLWRGRAIQLVWLTLEKRGRGPKGGSRNKTHPL
jgi:hypothetical protein